MTHSGHIMSTPHGRGNPLPYPKNEKRPLFGVLGLRGVCNSVTVVTHILYYLSENFPIYTYFFVTLLQIIKNIVIATVSAVTEICNRLQNECYKGGKTGFLRGTVTDFGGLRMKKRVLGV